MGTVHKGYRLNTDLVDRIDAWADDNGMTEAEAVRTLLAAALDGGEVAETDKGETTLEMENESLREQRDILREYLATTKEHNATLTAQINEKDRQIERLQVITEHCQTLQAAHVAGAISGDVAHDVAQDGTQEETQPRGIWLWLAKKINGR